MSFKDKLSDKRIYGLDEVDFSHKVFPLKKYTQWLYNHVGEKLGIYYITFFSFSNFLMRCFTRCYMKEYYTSPAPQNFEQFVYCLKTGLVENHKKLLLPYLHFLFFKKTPYYSPKHFWEGDFYNVPKIKDNMNGYIIFTNKSVSYEENNPHSICI